MKTWARRGAFLAVIVFAIVLVRFVFFRADLVPVTVAVVERGRVDETVTNSKGGTIKTRHRAAMSPEVSGRVERIAAREGEHVKRGEILLELANDDLEAQVALAERSLEAAVSSREAACLAAEHARRVSDRLENLSREEIVSEDQLDQARSDREIGEARCAEARAQVQRSDAALDVARVALDRSILRAPFDGIVAEVDTEVGEWITPSPPGVPIPPVLDVLDPDTIYVSAPLDEVDAGRVTAGMPVRITMDSHPGLEIGGSVSRVASYVLDVEEQNRTFEIEVEFDDPGFARTLLPGTSADVEVVIRSREDVLRVPTYALIEGRKVLLVRDGTLVSVPAETGLSNWDFTEITGGLEPGDRVVVSLDRLEVKEGARVEITGEAP